MRKFILHVKFKEDGSRTVLEFPNPQSVLEYLGAVHTAATLFYGQKAMMYAFLTDGAIEQTTKVLSKQVQQQS